MLCGNGRRLRRRAQHLCSSRYNRGTALGDAMPLAGRYRHPPAPLPRLGVVQRLALRTSDFPQPLQGSRGRWAHSTSIVLRSPHRSGMRRRICRDRRLAFASSLPAALLCVSHRRVSWRAGGRARLRNPVGARSPPAIQLSSCGLHMLEWYLPLADGLLWGAGTAAD